MSNAHLAPAVGWLHEPAFKVDQNTMAIELGDHTSSRPVVCKANSHTSDASHVRAQAMIARQHWRIYTASVEYTQRLSDSRPLVADHGALLPRHRAVLELAVVVLGADAQVGSGLSPDVLGVDDRVPFAIDARQRAEVLRLEERQDDDDGIEAWEVHNVLGAATGA